MKCQKPETMDWKFEEVCVSVCGLQFLMNGVGKKSWNFSSFIYQISIKCKFVLEKVAIISFFPFDKKLFYIVNDFMPILFTQLSFLSLLFSRFVCDINCYAYYRVTQRHIISTLIGYSEATLMYVLITIIKVFNNWSYQMISFHWLKSVLKIEK